MEKYELMSVLSMKNLGYITEGHTDPSNTNSSVMNLLVSCLQ